MDHGHNCSVIVATDSQSVIHHSRRRGHSVVSKNVGLRGLWLQEALVDGKLELEKVDTAMNPADVCTKGLPGNRIRELCRLARVYVCCSEGDMGDDPDEWRLSRLGELCRVINSNRAATLSLKGRVDFTCLNCFSETHFATAVRQISAQLSVLRKSECFKHALVISVLT